MMKLDLHECFTKYPYAELESQDGSTRFRICTYSYAYPEITIGYDADWHRNFLSVSLPAFRVEIDETMLQGESLRASITALKEFSSLEKSDVTIEPLESYFSLSFSYNTIKKVVVKGTAEYPLGWGARLEYEFETDLTYVDKFIAGLQGILEAFPVRK